MRNPSAPKPAVAEWLGHVKALAEGIGPRGPTREGERRGAEYARASLEGAGLAPVWQVCPSPVSGGNTEAADAGRARVPAISLLGKTRAGVAPYWHQRQDTFDKMDPEAMARTWELATALIREIDGV